MGEREEHLHRTSKEVGCRVFCCSWDLLFDPTHFGLFSDLEVNFQAELLKYSFDVHVNHALTPMVDNCAIVSCSFLPNVQLYSEL